MEQMIKVEGTTQFAPYILHIPHASTHIPEWAMGDYVHELLQENVEKLTDWATDAICSVEGGTTIVAPFSRVFCDVERFDDEHEPQFAIGRGFYYTHGHDGRQFRKINDEHKRRVYSEYYTRHHQELESAVNAYLHTHGACCIIDCHSFNDDPIGVNVADPISPDICIGTDTYHTPQPLIDRAVSYWSELGYSVALNNPYSGCMIPSSAYKTNPNVRGIMLEMNKRLYMDGESIVPSAIATLNRQFKGWLGR